MRSITRTIAAAAAVALLAAACGADDAEPDEPTETEDVAEEPEEADDAEAADDADPADDAEAADDADDEGFTLISDGQLTVCSDVPFPPFQVIDESTPSGYGGFDIDLMQAIADNLDLEMSVLEVGFDGIQSGTALAAGQCDIAASAMTITEERAENLEFSAPYFDATQSLIVLADSDVQTLEDAAGAAIGVQAATTGQEFALENVPDGTEVIEYQSGPDLFTALLAGTIVAGLQDLPVNAEQVQSDDRFALAEEYDTGEQYGFAAALGNTSLIAVIDAELEALRADGTYDEIFDGYFAG